MKVAINTLGRSQGPGPIAHQFLNAPDDQTGMSFTVATSESASTPLYRIQQAQQNDAMRPNRVPILKAIAAARRIKESSNFGIGLMMILSSKASLTCAWTRSQVAIVSNIA